MPYRSNRELPDSVKNSLPENAQAIWRNVFNSAEKSGDSEEIAIRKAWSTVKRSYKKEGDKWVKAMNDYLTLDKAFKFSELEGVIYTPVLKEGTLHHDVYGKITITKDSLLEMKDNFDKKVRGIDLVLDENHDPDHKSRGTFEELEVKEEEGRLALYAKIKPNTKGLDLVKSGEYLYFSPEFVDEWTHPSSNKTFKNVLLGGALTNRPFQKDLQKVAVFSENLSINTINMADDVKDLPTDVTTEEVKTEEVSEVVEEKVAEEETVETKPEATETSTEVVEEAPTQTVSAETEKEEPVEEVKQEIKTEDVKPVELSEKKLSEMQSKFLKLNEELRELKFSEEKRKLSEETEKYIFSDRNKDGILRADQKENLVKLFAMLDPNQRQMLESILGSVSVKKVEFDEIGVNVKDDTSVGVNPISAFVAKAKEIAFTDSVDYKTAEARAKAKYPDLYESMVSTYIN